MTAAENPADPPPRTSKSLSEPAPLKRCRRFRWQFGLRGFLILSTVLAAVLGLGGYGFWHRHKRQLAFESVSQAGGVVVRAYTGGNRLYLTGDKIDDAVMRSLAPQLQYLPELWELDLVDTQVTDEGISAVKVSYKLRELWVHQASIGDDALAELQVALPDLEVVRKKPDPVATGLAMHPIYRHAVASLAWSSDSQSLALGNGEGLLRLWHTGEAAPAVPIQAHENWTFALAFSPDGRRLATGGGDNRIALWDMATGKCQMELVGHTDDVHAVAFADLQTLVSTGDDKTVRVWDLTTGQPRHLLTGHTRTVPTLAVSQDGRTIASGSRDRTIRLWDVESGQLRCTLEGHQDDVLAVRFSPDDRLLASASYDATVRLWNVERAAVVHVLQGHESRVFSVGFSPDGASLASGGVDGMRLWNVDRGEFLDEWREQTYVAAVAFRPDGRELATASADSRVLIHRLPDGEVIREWHDPGSIHPEDAGKSRH